MGRPRKPTVVKKAQGTYQPCYGNPAEPTPVCEIPEPPEHLGDLALKLWPQYGAMLHSMGVLARCDRTALESLCETHAEIIGLRQEIAEHGKTTYSVVTQSGDEMIRGLPQVSQLSDAERRLLALLTQFGLTPASRSKVSKIVERKASKFDKLGPIPINRGA